MTEAANLEVVQVNSLDSLLMRRLYEGEEQAPPNVRAVCRFLCERQVGFVLSRNAAAAGCRDARSKRTRLGHTGIPLFDELKSLVLIVTDTNQNHIVAVHCRADCEVAYPKVLSALNLSGDVEKLENENLKSHFGLEYGTVNPVLLELSSAPQHLTQVFDIGLMTPIAKIPGTMMTNAGDHTWAIEFDAARLCRSFSGAVVADVAEPEKTGHHLGESRAAANPRAIGIVTGNGPDSGMALWKLINEEIVEALGDRFLGDISLPQVTVVSVPEMGLSMELKEREQATWRALRAATERLCRTGVEIIAVACNTTQVFHSQLEELCETYGVRFICMAQVVIEHIRELEIEEFAIIGIDTVAELGEWSAFRELSKFNVERLNEKMLNELREIGYSVKQKDNPYHSFQRLVNLLDTYIRSTHIVVALTEISIILESQSKKSLRNQKKTVIDNLELYAKSIAQACLKPAVDRGQRLGPAKVSPAYEHEQRLALP